jgi:hypothetical protein
MAEYAKSNTNNNKNRKHGNDNNNNNTPSKKKLEQTHLTETPPEDQKAITINNSIGRNISVQEESYTAGVERYWNNGTRLK